jgi:hypothetical protein
MCKSPSERIVEFHEAWAKPDQAASWLAKKRALEKELGS